MKKTEHHLFLSWILLSGLIVFGLYAAWNEGILSLLYGSDKSKISLAISFLYILVTIHCAIRAWYVSRQVNLAHSVSESIINTNDLHFELDGQSVQVKQTPLPASLVTEYVHDLVTRSHNQGDHGDADTQNESELIDIYESRLKGPDEIGWFATDAMIKLGLLGTIIGFILMLSSVVNITEFDVATMQKILSHMSSGMGTALYTTMAGLVTSLLAAAQYHMIERHIDEMVNSLKHLAQVHILPNLNQAK